MLIFGSVLVADRLAGFNVADEIGGIGESNGDGDTAAAVGTPGSEGVAVASPSSDDGDGDGNGDEASTPTENQPSASPLTVTASPTAMPVDLGDVDNAKETAEAYAEVWSNGNYDQLYDLLSSQAQGRISREDFIARYEAIGVEAGIAEVKAEIVGGDDEDELFPMKVEIESSRIGTITDDNLLPIVRDGDRYAVDWTANLIFSQLGDGLVRWESEVPQRGRILDRKGRPLAQMGQITKVGVVPGKVTNEGEMLQKLSQLLSMPQDTIKARIAGGQADWFMPVKDLPDNVDQGVLDQLSQIPGVTYQKWPARVYPAGPVTAHVVGYMSEITEEELPELAKRGYEAGDSIGRTGIEAYAEEWLAGKRGGVLKLIAQDGSTIRVLGETPAEQAHDIVLTIDLELQQQAYDALGDREGAAVVLDPNNGAVLTMVSRPSYDPNQFVLGVSDEYWAELNDPTKQPLVNRATMTGTSTGSTFKVITAAAGFLHLGLNQNSVVPCPGEFRLDGADAVWRDWVPGGQGDLTMHNAIVRSCNTVFYRIGAELDQKGETLLADVARGFGMGQPTGLPELFEVAGVVPDPDWKMEAVGDFWARGDAVNFAIGQGYFLATPLQLANAYAALANGGTLYQPHLTLDIVKLDGTVVKSGEVKENGKLPINAEQINWIRSALYDVINAPNGTATEAFAGIQQPVSGKTGTQENSGNDSAWFAAYTPSDAPGMTTVITVKHGGAGSKAAAPVARQIIDKWWAIRNQ